MFKALLTAALLISGLSIVHAGHFPYDQGNIWEFSYISVTSGMMGGSTDSGTVKWTLDSLEDLPTGAIRWRARIIQEKALMKISSHFWFPEETPFDSLVVPPQISLDTLYFIITEGFNGIIREGDTCWSFFQDPAGEVPNTLMDVRNVKVWYKGDSIEAIEADPMPCREGTDQPHLGFLGPDYFTTAEGIGPVGWYTTSSPLLMDYFWSETWTLTATNVDGGTGLVRRTAQKAVTGISEYPASMPFVLFRSKFNSGKSFTASGKLVEVSVPRP